MRGRDDGRGAERIGGEMLLRRAEATGQFRQRDACRECGSIKLNNGVCSQCGLIEDHYCVACGKTKQVDELGVEDWACECLTCRTCEKRYLPTDDEGPRVASTDELALEFGEGHCAACWRSFGYLHLNGWAGHRQLPVRVLAVGKTRVRVLYRKFHDTHGRKAKAGGYWVPRASVTNTRGEVL